VESGSAVRVSRHRCRRPDQASHGLDQREVLHRRLLPLLQDLRARQIVAADDEFVRAGGKAVRLQDVGDDVELGFVVEDGPEVRRHRVADLEEEPIDRLAAPALVEPIAGERRTRDAGEVGAVTAKARRGERLLAARRLRRREDALPDPRLRASAACALSAAASRGREHTSHW
jgi:hypothetical protein